MKRLWRLLQRKLGRRHRYTVVIVGNHSGNVSPLNFVTFRSFDDAEAWIDRLSRHHLSDRLTHYEVRRIKETA